MTKFLIVSDIHAFVRSKDTTSIPSLVEVQEVGEPSNILREIAKLLEHEDLKADWVICPGDLGDRASPDALKFVWSELVWLRDAVGARYLIGSAGNHDMDSRFINNSFSPKENLLALHPPFPGVTLDDCDKYWGSDYCIYKDKECRIVNLNSSAFHGYGPISDGKPGENEYGRISERTISRIVSEVTGETYRTNILLTHHHLIKNDHMWMNEQSEMRGGNRLLHKLTEATQSSWIVVHGHLHYPDIDYGRGSSLAPVVLSAGSAAATYDAGSSASPPNQIYLLDTETDPAQLDGWQPCGIVHGWYWSHDGLWERSPPRHRISYGSGFGSRLNPKQAADRFERALKGSGQPYMNFEEAFAKDPLLRFLLPADLDLAIKELTRRAYKVTIAPVRSQSVLRPL